MSNNMPENRDELLVHPLFYDALSGEFCPPTDPEERLHTLGRLSYAAFLKGTLDKEDYIPGRTFYNYEPSWAQGVGVRISTDAPNTRLGHMYLVAGANRAKLYIQDVTDLECSPGLRLESSTLRLRKTYSLELGSDLTLAKSKVTEAAQAFFEKVKK